MQERHFNPKLYFDEQAKTTEEFYIPFLENVLGHIPTSVLEIGCGYGGNLLPFAQRGIKSVGADLNPNQIEVGQEFHNQAGVKTELICNDVFTLEEMKGQFEVILIHDVIEHIGDKYAFIDKLKSYLCDDGIMFIGFPAWQMPFGGHQQMAVSKVISHLPFLHLLPMQIYKWILKTAGETEGKVRELVEIKETACPIEKYKDVVAKTGVIETYSLYWFINPNYKTKFGLKPRKLWGIISSIPWVRNFFTTSYWSVIKTK